MGIRSFFKERKERRRDEARRAVRRSKELEAKNRELREKHNVDIDDIPMDIIQLQFPHGREIVSASMVGSYEFRLPYHEAMNKWLLKKFGE